MNTEKTDKTNPIITYSDAERAPLLEMPSQPCDMPLTELDEEAIILMDGVLNELDDKAAGLAAVQIGYPRRIFLMRNGEDDTNNVFINPTIISRSTKLKKEAEGCLSLPGLELIVERPKSVTLQYFDLDNTLHEETFTDFWARCVLHEMDHLDGQLITNYVQKGRAIKKRTKFGMIRDDASRKRIAKRRAKNKRAKMARKQ